MGLQGYYFAAKKTCIFSCMDILLFLLQNSLFSMKLLLAILAVFLANLFPVAAQDYYIDLSKKSFSIPRPSFTIARVADARANKQSIGHVQKELTNQRAYATFRNSLEIDIESFILRNMPAQKDSLAVIMKVLKLQVKEYREGSMQTATAELIVDFICEQNAQFFPLSRISSVKNRRRIDVTGAHDNTIADAIADCLKQLSDINIKERINKARPITWEDVTRNYNESEEFLPFAILNDTILKRGFYKTPEEFKNNAPSFVGDFELDKRPRRGKDWEGEFNVTPYMQLPGNKRKTVKNIWGFSDGQTSYIKHHGDFFPLVREGNNFTFYGYQPQNTGIAPGIITGAIPGAISATVTIYAATFIKTKYLYTTQTGKITFYDQYLDAPLEQIANIKVVAYYLKDKSSTSALKFELTNTSDTLTYPLEPNSFVELEWTIDRANPQLFACTSADSDCYPFVPTIEVTSYIEIKRDSKSKQLVVEQVEAQKGEFYVKKLKGSQK